MSADGTFVTELAAKLHQPQVLEGEGRPRLVTPPGWTALEWKRPSPAPLKVGTLSALVDYLEHNHDGVRVDEVLVHIESPSHVALRAALEDEAAGFRRHAYLVATTELVGVAPFPFGQYLDAEAFVIGLQTAFVGADDRDKLLLFVASIRENSVLEVVDDTVSQQVKTARGVALVDNARVPNPVTLRPFRTFREVEQPASAFVLRARPAQQGSKPTLALFEADGGAWKVTAIETIARYLRAAIIGSPTILA
jgi:hypothetical protein